MTETTWKSLAHSRWECKYHVVFIPKYRRKALYGEIRASLGGIFHELARQKECRIVEGHLLIVEACLLMGEKNVGCLVAVEGEKLRGILTDRDIALKVTGAQKDPQQTKVRDIMTANPTRIAVSKTLHDLTALMHSQHVRRVPIVDGGEKVLGMVSLDDLLILLGQEMADIGQGVSGALFRQPALAEEEAAPLPLDWLMSYL
jgi:predicted transcriptional regulator